MPNCTIGDVPSVVCAEMVSPCDASTLASSWITIMKLIRVEPGAAQLLGPRYAEQAELAHLADVLPGELRVGVVLGGDRRDFVAGELAHHLARREVLLGEVE